MSHLILIVSGSIQLPRRLLTPQVLADHQDSEDGHDRGQKVYILMTASFGLQKNPFGVNLFSWFGKKRGGLIVFTSSFSHLGNPDLETFNTIVSLPGRAHSAH